MSRSQALDRIETFLKEKGPHLVVTADSSGVVIAREDEQFRAIVRQADLVTPDSIGILWAARRSGCPMPERVSGVERIDPVVLHELRHATRSP